MSAHDYLMILLLTAGVGLLVALTVAVVQVVMMLISVRKTGVEARKKAENIFSAIDIVSIVFGGLKGVKGRLKKKMTPYSSNIGAIASGLKKGLNIFLDKKKKTKGEK